MKTEILVTKEKFMRIVNFIFLLFALLASCQSPKDKAKAEEKFSWNAGISAPKNYPAVPSVEFLYEGESVAGASTSIGGAQGWGVTMGGFTGGDVFKPVPDSVFVKWNCGFDLIEYEGGFKLPRKKMLELFSKGIIDPFNGRKEDYTVLVAGTAPGGNVTIWMQASGINTEIIKFKAKKISQDGRYEPHSVSLWTSTGQEAKDILKYINFHGIPYKVWETGEKEYKYDIGFSTEEESKKNIGMAITGFCKDGSIIYSNEDPMPYVKWNENIQLKVSKNKKLPVHFYMQWISQDNQEWYEAEIVLPNDLDNQLAEFQKKYGNNVFIIVGMDKVLQNNPYTFGRIRLENSNGKNEIMKFRAAKLNLSKTRIKKYEVSKYSLPKDFIFPTWEKGKEPLTTPDVDYWQEK